MAMRAVILALVLSWLPAARAGETRVHVGAIPDADTFETYSRVLGADRFGKFLIEQKTNRIFYFDVNLYRLHSDFVFSQFYGRPMTDADIHEYNRNYDAEKPRFIMGYLTHHLKTD